MMHGVITDLKNATTRPCYAGEKDQALQAIKDKMPAIVKSMGDKKLLNGAEPCWLDFLFFEILECLSFISDGALFTDYPELKTYHSNVANLPKLKEYLASDKNIDKNYQFNNKHAKINNEIK